MKEIIALVSIGVGIIFLPWWAAYGVMVLTLIFSSGYIGLIGSILLDVYALPAAFPYASVSFLVLVLASLWIKSNILDRDSI